MSDKVAKAHPFLMHYTTSEGLKGIVESGSLWASNAKFLNDSEETVHYLNTRLPEFVREVAEDFIKDCKIDRTKSAAINKLGGSEALVARATSLLVDHLKARTLQYIDPYILSLSSPASELISRNGLLSQWRAYGSDGGYAIKINTEKFWSLLREEEKKFHYQHLEWGDVFYYGASHPQAASDDARKAEAVLREEVYRMIETGTPRNHMNIYFSLTTLSCLSKHWGFFEEQEVRVVAIPQRDASDIINTDSNGKTQKLIHHRTKGGTVIPYIAITGDRGERGRLPIESVIVGPHKDKDMRKLSAETLLRENGYDVPVIVSAIPYLGS
ncbi:DUF2971 domain-containing protein [Arenimonas sp.]|uniref:DUF2971 domain-containing protein n=1 Tax=Arenimonas sp. TaxID=1872635 RepID=UPI002E336384|nr:DUF2971 domain-containing protein [Arenimonas sp.]HEX4852867.1 DUF2971 domain-containing protein [Arenimonas sp.]